MIIDTTQVRCRIAEIDPSTAEAWLARVHQKQRRPSSPLVQAYARDMRAGLWKLNASPIIFSDRGTLLDGVSRLRACLAAEQPFRSLVVENIKAEFFSTIDTLRRRTLGNILSIRHEPSGRAVASVLGVIWRYYFNERDTWRFRPSTQELLYALEVRPELRDAVAFVHSIRSPVPEAALAALRHLTCRVSYEDADRFFRDFADPATTSPELAVVRWRVAAEAARRNRERALIDHCLALGIKAWNQYCGGGGASGVSGGDAPLVWRDQDRVEPIPRLLGLDANDGEDMIGASSLARDDEGGLHTGGEDMTASVEVITPQVAERLLANNPNNRPILAGVVERYRRDMVNGKWALNGQTVKIGRSGRLLDGQHRCRAAIAGNCSFYAIVVRQVADSVFDTLDIGARRTLAVALQGRGVSNSIVLAGALRRLAAFELGQTRARYLTNSELLAVLDRYPEVATNAARIAAKSKKLIEGTSAVALHYWLGREDPAKADEFFDRLHDGIDLNRTHPILHLRNRLIDGRSADGRPLTSDEKIALALKSWRAFVQGRPMRQLRLDQRDEAGARADAGELDLR